jgi:hypothetical protein
VISPPINPGSVRLLQLAMDQIDLKEKKNPVGVREHA